MSIQFDQENGHTSEGANYYQQITQSVSLCGFISIYQPLSIINSSSSGQEDKHWWLPLAFKSRRAESWGEVAPKAGKRSGEAKDCCRGGWEMAQQKTMQDTLWRVAWTLSMAFRRVFQERFGDNGKQDKIQWEAVPNTTDFCDNILYLRKCCGPNRLRSIKLRRKYGWNSSG